MVVCIDIRIAFIRRDFMLHYGNEARLFIAKCWRYKNSSNVISRGINIYNVKFISPIAYFSGETSVLILILDFLDFDQIFKFNDQYCTVQKYVEKHYWLAQIINKRRKYQVVHFRPSFAAPFGMITESIGLTNVDDR